MRHITDVYRALFSIRIAELLQYRVALVIWLIEVALGPIISIVIWSAVARARGGTVDGYTSATFAAYFLIAMLVNYFTQTWVFWEFEWRVREGTFSPLLLRPVHPIHGDIAQNIAYKLLMLTVIIPVSILIAIVFHPVFHLTWLAAIAFVFALLQAFVLRFAVEWALALLTFWSTRVDVLNQLYIVVLMLLSGQLVPLAFFPQPVQIAATVLPFRWMVAFPVELCLGSVAPGEILPGLAAQSAWLLLSIIILIVMWRTGIRRYSAVGA
ncbi:MAG TPA: ABC-2 family transporter protein [Ktedonobacteraceae bacterium]|nr:ABC-2 family transporter protein [Ktedonobacteraceae bacterium]